MYVFHILDPSNPKSVIVQKLSLLVDSKPEKELDLSNVASLKKQVITIKEGVNYKVKIDFIVQREIVHGLKYVQKTYRIGVPGKPASLIVIQCYKAQISFQLIKWSTC